MIQSLRDEEEPRPLAADKRAPFALQPSARTRYLRFIYLGYRVTALSVELANDKSVQFEAAFKIDGDADYSGRSTEPQTHAFDTHNHALLYARADAKRFIRAHIAEKSRAGNVLTAVEPLVVTALS